MKYPENERILVVRPCLKFICLGNKPASKLLSLLLYYARNCSEKEATFSFTTTQEELIADLIDEMDVKTLHRTAIPLLRLLDFLEVDGSSYRYKYTIHLDYIQYLLANYKDKQEVARLTIVSIKEQLDKLPIEQRLSYPIVFDRMQLEKCLIEIDKCPIELDKLPIQLEECLIPFRQMSNSKRGRKPRPQAALEATSENAESNRDITDSITDNKRESVSADASTPHADFSEDDVVLTERLPDGNLRIYRKSGKPIGALIPIGTDTSEGLRELITVEGSIEEKALNETSYHIAEGAIGNDEGPVISPKFTLPLKAKPSQQAPGTPSRPLAAGTADVTSGHGDALSVQAHPSLSVVPEPAQAESPPAARSASAPGTAQASGEPEKPKRGRRKPTEVQLTLHEQEIKEWYEELRGVEVSFSKRNVTALAALGKRTMSKDDFLSVTAILDSDTWFEEHKIGVDLFWIERQWENKIVFLQRKKSTPLDDKNPVDKYTAASRDKDRNERGLQRLRDMAIAEGKELPK